MPPPSVDALPPGFVIGTRYEVIAPLGRGGQGVVYSVVDHHLGQNSALKILTATAPGEVWREASLLTRLSGKYLLPVRNADLVRGIPFVVTEIAQHGTTSDKMIPNVGVPTEQAVQWMIHASRGASRMHDHHLVHNDLKPENLFLNAHGDALLGDLGLASELNASGYAALTGGTAATMSPEVAAAMQIALAGGMAGEPCSVASDVYSLGATLYWLLVGRAPYAGSFQDILAQVVAGPPPALSLVAPHVPRGIRDAVEKSMARLPNERFSKANELEYALSKQSYPKRKWSRRPPHPGHETCYTGIKGKSALAVCVSTEISSPRLKIAVTHQSSGRHATPPSTTTRPLLPQRLRTIFRNYS